MGIYFALSSFLLGFYAACDGENWVAVFLAVAGAGAIGLEYFKKGRKDIPDK